MYGRISKKFNLKKLAFVCFFTCVLLVLPFMAQTALAVDIDPVSPIFPVEEVEGLIDDLFEGGLAGSTFLQIMFLTLLIVLLPSILVVATTFTRLIIIFSFLRSGLGTQQMPPNTVLIGLALMLTMFFMNPYIEDINQNALQPLSAGEITQGEAIDNIVASLREFMLSQGQGQGRNSLSENIVFFGNIAGVEWNVDEFGHIASTDEIPTYILLPAFILHELAIGFVFGVFIFIPFIIIDMVVASVLMAMGMMMLPPAMISLPFKVMLFVLVDGWRLVINTAAQTF
ncbi:MAG: flagellar type III secretion system pore protein FliP [Clostridiales bacterium]|jgi:flagellar biosynthetic protein FliP|nr:flagellar type III secretion system pore protein FliP [Clostridiales bacterium]